MAGIAMEKTLGTPMTRQRIAIMIEYGEGVAVLKRSGTSLLQ